MVKIKAMKSVFIYGKSLSPGDCIETDYKTAASLAKLGFFVILDGPPSSSEVSAAVASNSKGGKRASRKTT